MTPTIKSIELPRRVTLQYVEQGDPAGVPVLLLHGVTDSWHSFEPVLPHLPSFIHAFALTQRGHGDSDRPPGYRTRDFAADVAEFLKALDVGPAVIVGHSMGATNAQRFVIDHRERTLGLLLAGTFAGYRSNPMVLELWVSIVSKLTDPVDPGFVREFQESTLAQPIPGAVLETVVAESMKLPALVWRAAFEGFLEDDVAHELGKITVPTLIMWGTQDAFAKRLDQDALLRATPGSRLVVYQGAGHALHWEEPKRFAEDLVAFVRAL